MSQASNSVLRSVEDVDRTSNQEVGRAGTNRRDSVRMKRVSFLVPETLYDDLQDFAAARGDSMTGVFRWCLGVGKAVWDELQQGHHIGVSDDRTKLDKQFVFHR